MDVQLLHDCTKPKLYRSRWYVLSCLSLLSCIQNVIWVGYGPVAQSAKAVFQWSDSMIDMLVNFGNISCIICILPASWMLDLKGLRTSMMWATFLIAVGSGCRCLSSEPSTATWLVSIGQTVNGVSGTVAFAGPSLLSETWFPPNERATATAISLLFTSVGGAVAFIIGPQVVSEPKYINCTRNISTCYSANSTLLSNLATLRDEIMLLNYIEFGVAALLMITVFIYFPNAPPTPPSETAGMRRTDFKAGTKKLFKMLKFWHIAFMFAIPSGVYGSWGSVLDVNLKPFGISQKEAGWLDFYGSIGGTIFGILLSRFSDIFMKRIKSFLVVVYSVAALFFVIFTLMCTKIIHSHTGVLYFTCIGGSILVGGAMPLFFELSCETTYPIGEGVTTGLMTLALNLTGSMFLLLSLIPNIGSIWPNWTLIGCIVITVPMLIAFKADYKRIDVDVDNKPD
ncbi:solute carrier family 49 member 4 homolog [Mytilus edulis]|uniref:solute carrier family 49 member 4 homolog n=1 Tax=Mytilus edulis TaxID=6550 RepID=UPI0039EEBA62